MKRDPSIHRAIFNVVQTIEVEVWAWDERDARIEASRYSNWLYWNVLDNLSETETDKHEGQVPGDG